MESATDYLFKVGDNVLELVLKSLAYSSIDKCNEDISKIKTWIMQQPHFPEVMGNKKIQNFVILNKGSVERTKEKIENYYKVRSHLHHIFENINPKLPYLDIILKASYFVPLPKLTKELYRVCFTNIRDASLMENLDPIDFVRLLVNIQELRLIEDVTYGDVFIFDCTNLPTKFVLKLTPIFLYNTFFVIYKKVFSSRLKAVYIINALPAIEKILIILGNVLSPKLFQRIHFCESLDFLKEQIGEEVLPTDLGGKEKSLEELTEMLRQKFIEHEDYFDQLDHMRINEELRPQKVKDDEMFGLSGHFKKLELD